MKIIYSKWKVHLDVLSTQYSPDKTECHPSVNRGLAASWWRHNRGDPAEGKGLLHRISPDRRLVRNYADEPSGLLPLKFLVVIDEMHKNLWRSLGSVPFINWADSKFLFLVRKASHANCHAMISRVHEEINVSLLQMLSWLLSIELPYFTRGATQATRHARVSFEWPGRVKSSTGYNTFS